MVTGGGADWVVLVTNSFFNSTYTSVSFPQLAETCSLTISKHLYIWDSSVYQTNSTLLCQSLHVYTFRQAACLMTSPMLNPPAGPQVHNLLHNPPSNCLPHKVHLLIRLQRDSRENGTLSSHRTRKLSFPINILQTLIKSY